MDNKQLLIYGGVAMASAGIGFGAGYLVFKKKFQAIADAEIESVRNSYRKAAVVKPELKDVVREFEVAVVEPEQHDIISREGYQSENDGTDADAFRIAHGRVPTTYELIQMGNGIEAEDAVRNLSDHDDAHLVEGNIFDNPQPDPDTLGEETIEEPPRSANAPYVISTEEWYANETNYDQITLTYWADDDVLADDNERMVTQIDEVVGATNMHRFGFKSDNIDIVYVRNDRLKVDYEVTKDERNYAEVIHNIDPSELNDSAARRRMRSNDE